MEARNVFFQLFFIPYIIPRHIDDMHVLFSYSADDLGDLCQVDQISLTSRPSHAWWLGKYYLYRHPQWIATGRFELFNLVPSLLWKRLVADITCATSMTRTLLLFCYRSKRFVKYLAHMFTIILPISFLS